MIGTAESSEYGCSHCGTGVTSSCSCTRCSAAQGARALYPKLCADSKPLSDVELRVARVITAQRERSASNAPTYAKTCSKLC
jgi:hypothetical protein